MPVNQPAPRFLYFHSCMKNFFLCLLLLLPPMLRAQKQVAPTDSIIISGEVTKGGVVRMADLKKLPERIIGDLVLVNAKGESRGTARGLKGVLLKEVLSAAVRFNTTNPADWSRFYFVLVASDGFTALYSWNELFNSPTGDRT